MAFMIYRKEQRDGKLIYVNENKGYSLAGNRNGLLYRLWLKKGSPAEEGWTVSADELLKEYGEGYSAETNSLVIDYHPDASSYIGLIEIICIHLITYEDDDFIPMMLELKDTFGISEITVEAKEKLKSEFEVSLDKQTFVEFLYLKFSTWNWGRNGSTNAVFLHKETRDFFRQYF